MGPLPFIVGALVLRKRNQRHAIGANKPSRQEVDSAPAEKVTSTSPWFSDGKTVTVWPKTVKLREMRPEDLMSLATIANQLKELAAEKTPSGQFKAPVRDPGLEKKFRALMELFAQTLRRMGESPEDDGVFWARFGVLLSVYRHFREIQKELGL